MPASVAYLVVALICQEPVLVAGLYVNGQPVLSEPSAVQIEGRVFVPARAVLERLGAEVKWNPERQEVRARREELEVVLRLGETKAQSGGQEVQLDAPPRIIDGSVMIPLRSVATLLGAKVRWEAETKSVHIELRPAGEPVPAKILDIAAKPLQFEGKLVLVKGEYRGWQGSSVQFATRFGPPVTRSDWVVRDATGDMYVAADKQLDAPFALQPLSNLGRRIELTGLVELSQKGFPYLKPLELKALDDPICTVATSKDEYSSGDTVWFTMTIGNPSHLPQEVTFPSAKQHDFVVYDSRENEVWRWSWNRKFAQEIREVTWYGGFSAEISESWDQHLQGNGPLAAPGLYTVVGEVTPKLRSYPHRFAINPAPKD